MFGLLRISIRRFGSSSWHRMPRGPRIQKQQTQDEVDLESDVVKETGLEEWSEFLNNKKLSDDNRIESSFGNIRFDKDNLPKLFTPEQISEDEQQNLSKPQPKNFILTSTIKQEYAKGESMFFEEDEIPVSNKVQPNVAIKENLKSKDTPKKNKKNYKDDPKTVTKSDNNDNLNYFDEITFGDKFRNFDSAKVNVGHQVIPGPVTGNIKSSMEDLNFVDEQYLGSSRELASNSEMPLEPLNEMKSISTEPQIKDEQTTKACDADNFIDEQYFKPAKYVPIKEIKAQEIDENIEQKPKKVKKVKVMKEAAPSALAYVRTLRKQTSNTQEKSEFHDPVTEIGKNITTRMAEASFPLSTTMSRKRREESNDENLDIEMNVYKDISTYSPPNLSKYISVEVEKLLISKVLYNDNEIIGLWKPYGLPMFSASTRPDEQSLEKYLPSLAKELGYQNLFEVHRLDSTTTGVVLLATSEARRKHLKQLFASKKIVKTYYAITNGVPSPREGIVNIAIGEGKIGERYRPTLKPDYSKDNKIITNKKTSKSSASPASTEYKVLSHNYEASLVEILMLSGVKHQIRVHLGLGLGTPILGDNKYSYPDQLGPPQRIKGSILNKLGLKKSQARDLPIFLHSKRISIPEVLKDKTLTILANKPHFFNKVQKRLRLRDLENV